MCRKWVMFCLFLFAETLMKLNFEQTMEFLQIRLEEDFGYQNDLVIDSLRNCIAELRRSKLLEPPAVEKAERPTKPFGEVLSTPLDDIHRSLSVALSRKRHSRTPCKRDQQHFFTDDKSLFNTFSYVPIYASYPST